MTRFLGLTGLFFSQISLAVPFRVFIDAGHGGKDQGAQSAKATEASITLPVAIDLANSLNVEPGIKAVLSRQKDQSLSLEERTDRAFREETKLFISIHCNSSPDPHNHGLEVFFASSLPPDQESLAFAKREQEMEAGEANLKTLPNFKNPKTTGLSPALTNIVEDLLNTSRLEQSAKMAKLVAQHWQGMKKNQRYTIQQAPLYVVSQAAMPAVLIELGFLTNRAESQRLMERGYRKNLVLGMKEAILKFKELVDKNQ